METTPMGQTFYREEANKLYPEGCTCWPQNNAGGDCPWCQVYYDGPICSECGEVRLDDERVLAGMKCGFCAYGI